MNTIRYTLFVAALETLKLLTIFVLLNNCDLIEFRFANAREKYILLRPFIVGAAIMATVFGTPARSKDGTIAIHLLTVVSSFAIGFIILVVGLFNFFSQNHFNALYKNKSDPSVHILIKAI